MAQTPDEKTYVEIPFIEQLKAMGWDHIEGDIDVPYLTERESFCDVLLTTRLRRAIKKINLDDNGNPCGIRGRAGLGDVAQFISLYRQEGNSRGCP